MWAQLNRYYKNYRFSLKQKYFKPYEDPNEALLNVSLNVEKEDWNYLVNLWSSSDWQVSAHLG